MGAPTPNYKGGNDMQAARQRSAGPQHGLYRRYNATLKRMLGGKGASRDELAEQGAVAAWLERNRLADYVHSLDGDASYAWTE
ncbi:MAG: hypothetical protein JO157_05760 [Acetobacteraceae bacterium]|nr:hypothetical protein [Acetobacteraceae bacterium]